MCTIHFLLIHGENRSICGVYIIRVFFRVFKPDIQFIFFYLYHPLWQHQSTLMWLITKISLFPILYVKNVMAYTALVKRDTKENSSIFLHENICFWYEQSILFIPTLGTTKKFVIMTIWMSRTLAQEVTTDKKLYKNIALNYKQDMFWIFVRIVSLRRF